MAIVTQTLDTLPPINEKRLKKIKAMQDKDIDLSDIPSLTSEQLARFVPSKLLDRSLYRPVKVPVKINYDADILEWFRSFGKGYQTRMNDALREYMFSHCTQ
ncbi:MAG: BrnA antitoxin family protein [Termitinemataceae bacterium]|nr:MAG: BrnA antitoxin family protein [Termitinemataceae bacterium]